MGFQVGVDVGGTFTDAVSIDEDTGRVTVSKVPTTRPNQSEGFLSALKGLQIDLPEIAWLVHGTTVGTNATLERNGGACGMITTRGFRDIIELGRRERPQLYGLFGVSRPLIPRDKRLEVDERLDANGDVVTPLDEAQVREAVATLRQFGVESVLIGFMHSYANPAHESRAAQIVRELWPEAYVTTSAGILREFREFERFSTASINAYLQPLIDRYIARLQKELKSQEIPSSLAIMQANGGIMTAEMACDEAVNTVLSGPAAGVIAASWVARLAGFRHVVTGDMGGTSFDVGMIVDGHALVTSDRDLDFNISMRIPTIDIHTVGAGGGSIASVTEAGLLAAGPASAGSTPGPIAYRRGGTEPTVTDANVLLGRLSNENLLGVAGTVDLDALRRTFREKLGDRVGQDGDQAAVGVLRVINDTMAAAIRLQVVQRGHDPRDFALFAFGGAGPLHGTALAREIGIPRVIVPYLPGLTCALGCIVADVQHNFVQTVGRRLADLDEDQIAAILARQRAEGEALLKRQALPTSRIEFVYEVDMQYEGQTHTERIRLLSPRPNLQELGEQLRQAYLSRFGIDLGTFKPRLVNLRTAVAGVRTPLDLKKIVSASHRPTTLNEARIGQRRVWFDQGWGPCPIYERSVLPIGAILHGPAIVNQFDTTTVIEPGQRAEVDDYANLVVEVNP